MRKLCFFSLLIFCVVAKAQVASPLSLRDSLQKDAFVDHIGESTLSKNWSFHTYSGFSTSYSFFHGGSAAIFSAPLGLQLDRRLNNNVYAFAGVSVAPAYVNFNSSFMAANAGKGLPGYGIQANNFGAYGRAELGLMYVNDARTFSISGSIGVQRGSNPLFFYQPINAGSPINFNR
jgi:hypothetical protein